MLEPWRVPLIDFIPILSPEYASPEHLRAWCEIMERCLTQKVRACCSVPIRHFKTQTTLHGIVWLLLRDPTLRFIIMSFDHDRAEWLGQETKTLAERAANLFGVPIQAKRGEGKKIQWTNESGGGVGAMSADQSREGWDVDILIVDDPLTELESDKLESRDKTDRAISYYTARVGRVGRPGSVALVMSRLAVDDPMGRRKVRGWECVEASAIIDIDTPQERAWAPNVMTLEDLKERRREWAEQDPSDRMFQARFQNKPRSASVQLFRSDCARYDQIPAGRYRYVIGTDLAYTIDPHSDFFAMVVLLVHENGLVYVVNVIREKRDLRRAQIVLHAAKARYAGAAIYSYASGPERGAIDYLNDTGVQVAWLQARYDKSTRARHTIDAWNRWQIVLPTFAGWDLVGFHQRCVMFTGLPKAGADDEQDALVSAWDGGVAAAAGAKPMALGARRIGRY